MTTHAAAPTSTKTVATIANVVPYRCRAARNVSQSAPTRYAMYVTSPYQIAEALAIIAIVRANGAGNVFVRDVNGLMWELIQRASQ